MKNSPEFLYVCGYLVHLRPIYNREPYKCTSTTKYFYNPQKALAFFEEMEDKKHYHEGCSTCDVKKYMSIHDKYIFVYYFDGEKYQRYGDYTVGGWV